MKLYEQLGTKNRKEQEKIVQQLIEAVATPVLDIVIRYDPRELNPIRNVIVIGGQPEPMEIIKILERARDTALAQVINSSGQPEMPPGEPPQHPDLPAEGTGEPSPELNDLEAAAE